MHMATILFCYSASHCAILGMQSPTQGNKIRHIHSLLDYKGFLIINVKRIGKFDSKYKQEAINSGNQL